MIKEQHKHYFKGLEIGMTTKKGVIEDLYFLTWTGPNEARKYHEPCYGGGILMAQINGKAIPIGELIDTL